jgi:nitrogen regulatory protein P-II 2
MSGHSMKLVTIVCEALARESVTGLLMEVHAHGYTLGPVEGTGAKGARTGEIPELGNVKIEVIVPPPVAEQLLQRLQRDFFPHYAVIAYEIDVRVMRSEKF